MADRSLDETPPGMSVIRDVMPGVEAEVATIQALALDGIANAGKGGQPAWWWMVAHLPADRTAFITLRTLLAGAPRERLGRARRCTTMAVGIADGLWMQLDYETWVEAEKRRQKVARAAGEEPHDMLAALKSRCRTVDRRAWDRWTWKIKRARSERWPTDAKVSVGTALIDCAVRGGGGWFEQRLQSVGGGKTERQIVLSDAAVAALQDLEQRAAIARPMRMPMICPPREWRWEETP